MKATGVPRPAKLDASRNPFLKTVQEYCDRVLEFGRDKFGRPPTPLFVDGINVDTREPLVWLDPKDGHKLILSNLASQQNLLRTFDGLSRLTGEARYGDACREAVRYAFQNLRDVSGLLYWGGHRAYDLLSHKHFGLDLFHELKQHYPYYELMWEVDPHATQQFIEAFWSAHILDWSRLDMNRHGMYGARRTGPAWKERYRGGPVFFPGMGLSFFNTGSDLFYAAALLHEFTGRPEPLEWANRMAQRYVETRDPQTGLGGYLFSLIAGDRVRLQFGPEHGERAVEGRFLDQVRATRKVAVGSICQFHLGETLGEAGHDFTRWALEDLLAFGRHAYEAERNVFHPLFTDGARLHPSDLKREGYFTAKDLEPWPASATFFWAYALAYRLTGDEFMRRMTLDLGRGLGLGDLEAVAGGAQSEPATANRDALVLLGLLELHRKTQARGFLELARQAGENLVQHCFHKGFFVFSPRHLYCKFDCVEPVSLLCLAAAMEERPEAAPRYTAGRSYFTANFYGRGTINDFTDIYPQTRPETPAGA